MDTLAAVASALKPPPTPLAAVMTALLPPMQVLPTRDPTAFYSLFTELHYGKLAPRAHLWFIPKHRL